MAASAIAKLTLAPASSFYQWLTFLGTPDMALTIAVAAAIYTFGLRQGKSIPEIMKICESAVLT